MSAVFRVKRRLDDEPLEALVLNYKKRKLNEDSDKSQVTLLQLAGTLNNQEDDIFEHIKAPTKNDIQDSYKKHLINLTEKIRNTTATNSKQNRYKVVNYFRSSASNDAASSSNSQGNEVTIVDIEENADTVDVKPSELSYVYDLYYTNSDDFGEANLEDFINVYPLSEELVYGSARDNGNKDSDGTDTDDSNDENNWRNDYPDESDVESIDESDMVEAVKRITIDDDLSSDDGEEGFVYSIDSEAAGFEEDIDPTDVRRYGEMYARFKARNKKLETKNDIDSTLYYGDIDENEYYY